LFQKAVDKGEAWQQDDGFWYYGSKKLSKLEEQSQATRGHKHIKLPKEGWASIMAKLEESSPSLEEDWIKFSKSSTPGSSRALENNASQKEHDLLQSSFDSMQTVNTSIKTVQKKINYNTI